MSPTPALEFTGERFTPECVREIWYEHYHRYAFARPLVAGRRVLDAACGEGYGSAILAQTASSVLGLDIADTAVAHARARYGDRTNLRFEQADVTQLDLAPGSVDVVVSFETLEHVEAQEALVDGFARALTDDGLLLISSPDKATYSDEAGFRNEFHVRELYRDELVALLSRHFPHVRLYGQRLLFQSALWSFDADAGSTQAGSNQARSTQAVTAGLDGSVETGLAYAPMYYVAACSRRPLPALPDYAWFGDRDESVYRHYNHEIRKNMAAGGRIAELERQVAELEAKLAAPVEPGANAPTTSGADATAHRRGWWRRWLG